MITTNSREMSQKKPKNILYERLPEGMIPGPSHTYDEAVENVNKLLTDLPKTDSKNLPSDLKKTFFLDKHSLTNKKPKSVTKKKRFLTRKARVNLNALKLPKNGWSYDSLEVMRNMWKDYMRQNLESIKKAPSCTDQEWSNFSLVTARSELVGAEIEVVRSKVVNQVGMTGTIVLETKMTFQIVTPQSQLKILLKENSVFQFKLDNLVFTVFGRHLITRPGERSVKKIKSVMTPDLV